MATVVKLPDGKFRAYVKGASEILLGKCTKVIADPTSSDLSSIELTDEDREMFNQTITSYAGQTLRTIGSSYRDFDSWPPAEAVSKEDPRSADFTKLHQEMTLVAIYGIKDPLRPSVIDAIKDCKRAGVVVRMVTGDNIMTGSAIARECGIYHPEDGGIAMEGPDFRRKSNEELKGLVPKLQVLARSSPEDKRILVRTLKDLGETVAVTGDGTNDAPALKMADIGFSMGIAGTEVAKEASAIILMDDNFASIVKGMMWGRAVNDSVKKFLQVRTTLNRA
jgi:Ca2+-transporting ATPase